MKKATNFLSALFLAGIMTTAVSCSSDDGGSSGLSKSWKVGENQYNQLFAVGEEDSDGEFTLVAIDALPSDEDVNGENINKFMVMFKQKPTVNGLYKAAFEFNISDLQDNEVIVLAYEKNGAMSAWARTEGNESKDITVTIGTGGLIHVKIPSLDASYFTEGENPITATNSTTIEADIVESEL